MNESGAQEERAPPISVVMPVRNAMPFLDQAIESTLTQSFEDFELVILDDASEDGSSKRLEHWARQDARIRLSRRDRPSGPAGSSNWVWRQARADLIARMDADDVAAPTRLERQFQVMKADPDAVLVGSTWVGIDAANRTVRPADVAALFDKRPLRFPFVHGSTMIRRAGLERVGGYRESCDYWEDADLFHRLAESGKVIVLTEPQYSYRFSSASNRLHSNVIRLEEQLTLQVQCHEMLRADGNYDALLADSERKRQPPPLRVFQQRAALANWAGRRSPALYEWFARGSARGRFAILPFVFLSWGVLSPRSLRWALGKLVSLRNLAARRRLNGLASVEWSR